MRLRVAATAALSLLCGGAWAEPAKVYAAGSLSGVLPKLIAAAKGAPALVVPFARNRMCVLAPATLGLTAENLLGRLLTPDLRLATSTPGIDPGGDYARSVFARAEAMRPGAAATLSGKALLLLGGPGSMAPRPGMSPIATIFAANAADALLYYCSGTAAAAREVSGLVSLQVPDALEVGPVYGLAVLSNDAAALRLALFMLSRSGQAIIAEGGLLPLLPAP